VRDIAEEKPFCGNCVGDRIHDNWCVLHVAYPELAGATTSSGKYFAAFIGILLFLVGLAQVFYIVVSSFR